MAMESSRHRTRASEVYNAFSAEDHLGYRYDQSPGYDDDVLEVVEERDDGWTTVGEVTFRMEKSPKKSRKPGSPKMPKIPPIGLPRMTKSPGSSPKKSSKEKSPATSPKRMFKDRSPFSSPKGSPKKSLAKAKIESPKRLPLSSKKVLPEIVESNVQQYRPVYQSQILSNENLVPKPYSSRYSGNITARPYKAPIASPRTILPQSEKSNSTGNLASEPIKPLKESKDARGKVKKSLEPTRDKEIDMYNAEMKLRSSLSDIKNSIEATLAAEKQNAKVSNIDDLLGNSHTDRMNNSKRDSQGLLNKKKPIEDSGTKKGSKVRNVSSFSSLDSLNSEEPCSSHSDLSAEETLALSVLDAAVDNSSCESFYNCTNKPFHSYNELEMMKERSLDHPTKNVKPLARKSPESKTSSRISLNNNEGVRISPESNTSSRSSLNTNEDARKSPESNTSSRNSLNASEGVRKSPEIKTSSSHSLCTSEGVRKSPESKSSSKTSLNNNEGMSRSSDSPLDCATVNERNGVGGSSASVASGNTLSRDSLDGFLSDDMKSLRNFVAQRSLDIDEPLEIEEDDQNKLRVEKKNEKHERNLSEESIDFFFEDVVDSPTHIMDSPEVRKNIPDEKKSNKKSPLFSRFTQKVSDKNKENEEKSKSSPFSPGKMLFFGSKDKKPQSKPKSNNNTKTEGWTSEAIEEYILENENTKEEALHLGLLDEEDLAIQEAKKKNPKAPIKRAAPEVMVHEVVKVCEDSCRKRQAPIPPSRGKSPSWNPRDIENYLLENNLDENLRLGLISKEDIEIYEWKRATGMSPICDTSWTRETLRKNKIVRGSSSSSRSASPVQSNPSSPPPSSPPLVHSPKCTRDVPHLAPAKMGPTLDVMRRSPSPSRLAKMGQVPQGVQRTGRMAPAPPVTQIEVPNLERGTQVPISPNVLPPRRRARAAPAPPLASAVSPASTSPLPPTPDRKNQSGHFAFRGFKVSQRANQGVGGSLTLIKQAAGAAGYEKDEPSQLGNCEIPRTSAEVVPESKLESKRDVNKQDSRVKKLGLDRIGVKLPGLSREGPLSISRATTPSDPKDDVDTPTPTSSGPPEFPKVEAPSARKETPYRRLTRLLGKDNHPAAPQPAEVPAHALFLRESYPVKTDEAADDEEGGIRKKLSDMRLRLGWLRRRGDTQVSVRPLPEEAQGWAESFHNLMASKYGQALFKAFLQREFSEENVEFWLAVEDFKKTRAAKMPSKASKIHSDYVAVQAPKEINLDPGTRAQIAKSLDCPDKCIFDAAQKRVQALMESDAYLRFLQSELYKELLHPETSPSSNPEAL